MSQPTQPSCLTAGTPAFLLAMRPESRARRSILFLVAALVIAVFLLTNLHYFWFPLHGGVDQNGYLVGGKMIAQTGSMALCPRNPATLANDPWQFVGRMWVGFDLGTPHERYFPKYPVGLPLAYAILLKLGGPIAGVPLAHLLSPVTMTLSLLGTYLLARLLLGSWPALAVMVLVALSPITLNLATNPNSHALSLFLVSWGMYFAVRWWLRGGALNALLAGLLVGATVSVRYSEGLLLLPLTLLVFFRIADARFREPRRWFQGLLLLVAWAIPVAALLWHNRLAMGAWTGYGPTNESTGFAWGYFLENWDTMLRQMYQMGFTLIFPLALGGLAAGLAWNWRVALFLGSWILPCLLLYTAYYWAPENVAYTRFFLTIFPALGISAFGLLLWPATHLAHADEHLRHRLKLGGVLALIALTLIALPLGVANISQQLTIERIGRGNLEYRAARVLGNLPPGSVLFSDDQNLLHHIQLVADYTLYSPEYFSRSFLDRLATRDPSEPQDLDPGRAKYLLKTAGDMTQIQLDAVRDNLCEQALRAGKRVFVFAQSTGPRPPTFRPSSVKSLDLRVLTTGTDPVCLPRNNPLARWGIAQPGRDRKSTTQPAARWSLYEVILRPAPATRPLATTRPTSRPRTVSPTTLPTHR